MIIGMTACIYKYLSLLKRCIPIHTTFIPYPANYKILYESMGPKDSLRLIKMLQVLVFKLSVVESHILFPLVNSLHRAAVCHNHCTC